MSDMATEEAEDREVTAGLWLRFEAAVRDGEDEREAFAKILGDALGQAQVVIRDLKWKLSIAEGAGRHGS